MSDKTDDLTTEATTVADEVETSTNEGTEAELTSDLEDAEASFEEETKPVESEESKPDEEATESEPEEMEELEEDAKESQDPTEDEESKEEAKPQEDKATTEEERKKYNDEQARKRIADRESRAKAKEEAQQKYLDDAEDNRDLALRQLQIDAYNNKIESNTNKLQNGIDKALANIDLFNKGTPAVQNRLLRAVDQFELNNVVKDDNGDPIEVKGDIYQYLQEEAESIKELLGDGARQQEKSKQTQQSRTLTTPVKSPPKPKKDPMLDGFDEEVAKGW
jgi:hypothetical protein